MPSHQVMPSHPLTPACARMRPNESPGETFTTLYFALFTSWQLIHLWHLGQTSSNFNSNYRHQYTYKKKKKSSIFLFNIFLISRLFFCLFKFVTCSQSHTKLSSSESLLMFWAICLKKRILENVYHSISQHFKFIRFRHLNSNQFFFKSKWYGCICR